MRRTFLLPLCIYARLLWLAIAGDYNQTNFFTMLSHNNIIFKTFNNGSLGSRNDEERSELRYVL